jgi:hypothetical protein
LAQDSVPPYIKETNMISECPQLWHNHLVDCSKSATFFKSKGKLMPGFKENFCYKKYSFDVHESVHHNINPTEITNKMRPCRRIYYSSVS